MSFKNSIKAIVRSGDESGYVAECIEIPVVTQGATLDGTIANLHEAVSLYLEDEDLNALGLAADPTIVITTEPETANG